MLELERTLEMEEKMAYLLKYIKKNGKIINVDMFEIQEKMHMSTAQQLSLLKKLAKQNKIQDLSKNWNEPMFRKLDPIDDIVDKIIDSEEQHKAVNIREKILRCIQAREGQFVELNLFMDFGISLDKQNLHIQQLIQENQIEAYKQGYRIKKV